MSTNDVPGARSCNNDELAMGCWAEHKDGSLILVESTEANRVIYSVFDVSKNPPLEYRDAMPEDGFKEHFSWKSDDPKSIKWKWHDKSPFPWDQIIKEGVPDGVRHAFAKDLITSAQKVAESRELIGQGKPVDAEELKPRMPKTIVGKVGKAIVNGLQAAIDTLEA